MGCIPSMGNGYMVDLCLNERLFLMPTLEQARRCPRCDTTGAMAGVSTMRNGKKVYSYQCENPRCKWFNTGWVVQVNPDGTIPEREKGAKQFEALDTNALGYAEAVLQKSKEELMKGEVDKGGL